MDLIYDPDSSYRNQQPADDDGDSIALSQISTETTGLSVRDMIRRYNSAANKGTDSQKVKSSTAPTQQSLVTAFGRANENGMKSANVQPSVKQIISKVNEQHKMDKLNNEMRYSANRRQSARYDSNASTNDSVASSSVANSDLNPISCHQNATQNGNSAADSAMKKKESPFPVNTGETVHLESHDSNTEGAPVQTSYQSRTTISRSRVGVRITIDIFFDQETSSSAGSPDLVTSRIETDLPCSRILSEFQDCSIGSGRRSETS